MENVESYVSFIVVRDLTEKYSLAVWECFGQTGNQLSGGDERERNVEFIHNFHN